MASRRAERQSNIRLKVMRLLSEVPEMSSRQIAEAVGISNGSAYNVLTGLVKKDLVKLQICKTRSKKGQYSYPLTPKGIHEKSILTHYYIKRKRKEYYELGIEIRTLEQETGLLVTPSPKSMVKNHT